MINTVQKPLRYSRYLFKVTVTYCKRVNSLFLKYHLSFLLSSTFQEQYLNQRQWPVFILSKEPLIRIKEQTTPHAQMISQIGILLWLDSCTCLQLLVFATYICLIHKLHSLESQHALYTHNLHLLDLNSSDSHPTFHQILYVLICPTCYQLSSFTWLD